MTELKFKKVRVEDFLKKKDIKSKIWRKDGSVEYPTAQIIDCTNVVTSNVCKLNLEKDKIKAVEKHADRIAELLSL